MNADSTKFEGCLLGLAIGDALGMPFEGMRTSTIKSMLGGKAGEFMPCRDRGLRAGQWTDDTKMALKLAESIARKNGKVDPADIARAYVEWYDSGDLRGIGRATLEAILNLKSGKQWSESGKRGEFAAGNGSAMRCAPIGLLDCGRPEKMKEDCRLDAVVTHNNDEAVAGSRAVCFFIARGVTQSDLLEAKPELVSECIEYIGPCEVSRALERARKLLIEGAPAEAAVYALGTSGYVVETVASAVFCFLKTPESFETTVVEAVMGGGDTDTTAAVAGAISGAWNGLWGIPRRWVEQVEGSAEIRRVANELFKLA